VKDICASYLLTAGMVVLTCFLFLGCQSSGPTLGDSPQAQDSNSDVGWYQGVTTKLKLAIQNPKVQLGTGATGIFAILFLILRWSLKFINLFGKLTGSIATADKIGMDRKELGTLLKIFKQGLKPSELTFLDKYLVKNKNKVSIKE